MTYKRHGRVGDSPIVGAGTYAKIEAARALGLPVVMVERPALPEGETVDSVAAALAWIEPRLA